MVAGNRDVVQGLPGDVANYEGEFFARLDRPSFPHPAGASGSGTRRWGTLKWGSVPGAVRSLDRGAGRM